MSQGWILPDGSMSSSEMEYNTPWLFEDPISDDLPAATGAAFVDPRVAAVSKTGALTDYINKSTGGGSSSSGTYTSWLPGESVEWSGGLGLPSWAANGLAQAGKFGLGAMGVPSLITGPLGAYASSFLGDENSTAESVRNKVGNSIIGAGLSAINPIAGITNSVLGALGFDAMRGLNNTFSPDTTKPESWRGGFFDPGYKTEKGSYITSGNENFSPYGGAQYDRVSSSSGGGPSSVGRYTPSNSTYFGGLNTGGGNNYQSSSSTGGGGWTSESSGSAYSSPSSDSSGGGWTSESSGSAYSSPSSDSSGGDGNDS